MNNELYEMKCGELILFGGFEVTRVPGGWLFLHYSDTGKTACFVKYNNEFDTRIPNPTYIPGSLKDNTKVF